MSKLRIGASILSAFPMVPKSPVRSTILMRSAGFQFLQGCPLRGLSEDELAMMNQWLPFRLYEGPWKWVSNGLQATIHSLPWLRHHLEPTLLDLYIFGYQDSAEHHCGWFAHLPEPSPQLIVHSLDDLEDEPDAMLEICPSLWGESLEAIIDATPETQYVLDIGKGGHLVRRDLRPDELTCRPEKFGKQRTSFLPPIEVSLPLLLNTGRVGAVHVKDTSGLTAEVLVEIRKALPDTPFIVWEGTAGKRAFYDQDAVHDSLYSAYAWLSVLFN